MLYYHPILYTIFNIILASFRKKHIIFAYLQYLQYLCILSRMYLAYLCVRNKITYMIKSLSNFRLSVLFIVLSFSLNITADNERWHFWNNLNPYDIISDEYHVSDLYQISSNGPFVSKKPAFVLNTQASSFRPLVPALQPVVKAGNQEHSAQLFHHNIMLPTSVYQPIRPDAPYLIAVSAPTCSEDQASQSDCRIADSGYQSTSVRSAFNASANFASAVMSALSPSYHRSVSNSFLTERQELANSVNRTPTRFKLPTIGEDVQPNDFDAFMQTASDEAYLYEIDGVKYYDMNRLTQCYNEYTQQLLASGSSPKDIPSWDTFMSWFNTASNYAAPIGDGADVVIFLLLLSVGYIVYTRRTKELFL